MNVIRRGLSWLTGMPLLNGTPRAGDSSPAASGQSPLPEPVGASVKPRHVLCFLGGEHGLAQLSEAARTAMSTLPKGFSIDEDYSRDEADERMDRSFSVCRDRVLPNAWTTSDEQAVAKHGSVLYLLGPRMTADTSVETSAAALLLVQHLIQAGAVAVKGESAGIAHGLARWQELVSQARAAREAGDTVALSRICRLAFARRPLEAEGYLESIGFHLVGLPEVYVSKSLGQSLGNERTVVALMDELADEMAQRGLDAALHHRNATLSFASTYDTDDFKFNPYGIVMLES